MIDEWAASVKPKADPAIISKHIEKMVEVREKPTASLELSLYSYLLLQTQSNSATA